MTGGPAPDSPAALLQKLPMPPETFARLETHRALLADWNDRMNLVGPNELAHYWSRHALDSAQLVALAPPAARRWLDLGTGAGFPGLVVAAILADRPDSVVTLVEKSPKKCQFLAEAIRAMAIPAVVLNTRVEDLVLTPVDVITARAFAPLPRLVEHAKGFLARGAIGLFPKGSAFEAELSAAGFSPCGGAFLQGSMRVEALESISNPIARVLRIQSVAQGV